MGVTESEAGRYDCRLGSDTLCSYNITVDTQRCAAPSKSHDYQKVYSDWCHEFEKYKMAMKTWERRQLVSFQSCQTLVPTSRLLNGQDIVRNVSLRKRLPRLFNRWSIFMN